MNEIVFTPAGLVSLLSKIDEFKDFDVGIVETIDGKLQLQVGESIYELDGSSDIPEVPAPAETVEQVDQINVAAYDALTDDDFDVREGIEAGLITELVKALKVGGMLRLAAKVLPRNLK